MNIEEYFDKIKSIQSEFLEFIENDENVEGNFQNLFLILEDKKIRYNKHDLRLFLHHVASISANHRRGKNFFAKIERVIQIFKSEIRKYYLNSEIFSIFKRDKRILLFLIEEKILIFDEYVARKMINEKYVKKKYPQYFAPEISAFKDRHWFPRHGDDSKNEWIDEINKKLPDRFHEFRKIGENERYICELIRNDNVIDFVSTQRSETIRPQQQQRKQHHTDGVRGVLWIDQNHQVFANGRSGNDSVTVSLFNSQPKCKAHPLPRGLPSRAKRDCWRSRRRVVQDLILGINQVQSQRNCRLFSQQLYTKW